MTTQYDNTATITETEDSASATLLVNVQCFVFETAYGKGGGNPHHFASSPTASAGGAGRTRSRRGPHCVPDLWAAAGQCILSNGTLVGDVTLSTTTASRAP